jgi:hypothetical protein
MTADFYDNEVCGFQPEIDHDPHFLFDSLHLDLRTGWPMRPFAFQPELRCAELSRNGHRTPELFFPAQRRECLALEPAPKAIDPAVEPGAAPLEPLQQR